MGALWLLCQHVCVHTCVRVWILDFYYPLIQDSRNLECRILELLTLKPPSFSGTVLDLSNTLLSITDPSIRKRFTTNDGKRQEGQHQPTAIT